MEVNNNFFNNGQEYFEIDLTEKKNIDGLEFHTKLDGVNDPGQFFVDTDYVPQKNNFESIEVDPKTFEGYETQKLVDFVRLHKFQNFIFNTDLTEKDLKKLNDDEKKVVWKTVQHIDENYLLTETQQKIREKYGNLQKELDNKVLSQLPRIEEKLSSSELPAQTYLNSANKKLNNLVYNRLSSKQLYDYVEDIKNKASNFLKV
ncbi:MAG: hypothetical protein Tsb0021_02230 [Chlamydiales bacterium]